MVMSELLYNLDKYYVVSTYDFEELCLCVFKQLPLVNFSSFLNDEDSWVSSVLGNVLYVMSCLAGKILTGAHQQFLRISANKICVTIN